MGPGVGVGLGVAVGSRAAFGSTVASGWALGRGVGSRAALGSTVATSWALGLGVVKVGFGSDGVATCGLALLQATVENETRERRLRNRVVLLSVDRQIFSSPVSDYYS